MSIGADTLLALMAGLVVGALMGAGCVMLLSPAYPLVLSALVLIPLSVWSAHKPWHGPRKKGSWRSRANWLRHYYSPPRSTSAITSLWGLLIGTGLAVPPTTALIWRH